MPEEHPGPGGEVDKRKGFGKKPRFDMKYFIKFGKVEGRESLADIPKVIKAVLAVRQGVKDNEKILASVIVPY